MSDTEMGAGADDGAEVVGVLDAVEIEDANFFLGFDGGEKLLGGDGWGFESEDADPFVVDGVADFIEFFGGNYVVSFFLFGAPF